VPQCQTNLVERRSGHSKDSGVNASSKLWGRSAEGSGVWGGVYPLTPPHGEGVWRGGKFLFCDLEMAYFGELWRAKFKDFFSLSWAPSVGFGTICGKFWIFEQSNE